MVPLALSLNLAQVHMRVILASQSLLPTTLGEAELRRRFENGDITDYEFSFNTIQQYLHYTLTFPTEDMKITRSGNYVIKIFGNAMPTGLGSGADGDSHTYVSRYFPQGLLYACLVEAFSFLKGPQDMLTLYEQKYTQELQKFASMQIGRRRRDDYTDGTIRIPIESPPQ